MVDTLPRRIIANPRPPLTRPRITTNLTAQLTRPRRPVADLTVEAVNLMVVVENTTSH
jgi:hypothetical protein